MQWFVDWCVANLRIFLQKQRKDNLNCASTNHTLLDIGSILIMITFLTSEQLPCGDIDFLPVPDNCQKCKNFSILKSDPYGYIL